MRGTSAVVLAVICTLLPFAAQFYGDRSGGWLMVDFRAYYCAALAQRLGEDPYLADSLQECESSTPAPYYHAPRTVTVPAPYPPYVLAFYYPLTFLPFGIAAILWWLLLGASLVLAASALARIAAVPFLVAWAALVLSAGLTTFMAGNVMPLALLALVVAALFLHRGWNRAAATLMAVALIEPQVTLPAVIALFIAVPNIRPRLALIVALLGGISILGGAGLTLEYLTEVIPAHALSEVSRDNQYSISTVLTALGVPDIAAVIVGSISYMLALVIGVFVALRLARRYEEPALVLLVPPAFSLLGGSFVHTVEIAAAVPAALVLFRLTRSQSQSFFPALLLLAVPWMLATSAAMFLAPLFPAAYLTYTLLRRNGVLAVMAAAVSCILILGLFALYAAPHAPAIPHVHLHPPIDPDLAEASWRQFVLGNVTNRPVMWLLRLPTWIGLALFAVCATQLATRKFFRWDPRRAAPA
ncbi:MAG: glycosyltransferase 87 family protein [Candidatus Cybelea sp.]